jgi:hypothetical protein
MRGNLYDNVGNLARGARLIEQAAAAGARLNVRWRNALRLRSPGSKGSAPLSPSALDAEKPARIVLRNRPDFGRRETSLLQGFHRRAIGGWKRLVRAKCELRDADSIG